MRIVHVVRQFRPGVGGIENYVANLARHQAAAGHEVTVVTLDRIFSRPTARLPAEEETEGYRVVRIPYRGSYKYPVAPSVLRHFGRGDIVHVHAIDFFCDFAALTAPLHRKPMVISTHGGFFHTGFARRLKRAYFQTVTRLSLGAYRAVLASSASDLATFGGIRKDGMVTVENGVDIGKFADAGAPRFVKHLVFIGRFASNKRIERLFDLLAALRARDGDWRLSVIGVEWDLTAGELARLADDRGVAEGVDFHVSVSETTIRDILGQASMVASASEYEGFGISVIECMSAGLQPVLSDIPAFRRVHAESGLGLIGDFARPDLLAERLIEAAPAMSAAWDERRAAAIEFARAHDWAAVAARIEQLYGDVLGIDRRSVLGVPVMAAGAGKAIEHIDRALEAGQAGIVAFLNSHAANIAARDGELRHSLRRATVLNDGIGLDLASRILFGRAFPANLNGTDFVPAYLARTRHRHRMFLLGARPDVAAAAAERFADRFPQHEVVGWQHGYFPDDEGSAIAQQIRDSGADLVLVALGNPRQEIWAARHFAATGARLAFCVGALFDFAAGAVPRAPLWIRRLRAEWIFRLAIEPRRMWRRYLIGNVAFLARVLRQRARRNYLIDAGEDTGKWPPRGADGAASSRMGGNGGQHVHAA
ncbi:WecB/TagA/CpsF family glycosyltransferase [Desertibaculum subflavum]|uniref:WecB/TagA/CpsF family glycosyltransferase n=1 Tax=Desertibaculum subflavum TaxID=2268458 RepID=UPI000E67153F